MYKNVVKICFNHFWSKKYFLTPQLGENRRKNIKIVKNDNFFDIKSTISEKWNHIWLFRVNKIQEPIKKQIFTNN